MIFLRYESFRSYLRLYPVTSALIALNIAYYIVIVWNGNPSDANHLYDYGGFLSRWPEDPYGMSQPWRYVTSMFMHGGIEHLLFNMFALLVFAPPLERLMRSPKYALFYLLCGVAGSLMSSFVKAASHDPSLTVGIGASGAIYGVYGAYLYLSLFRKSQLDEGSRKTVYTILIFGVIYSFVVPGIGVWAHIGGGIAGFLLYNVFERSHVRKQRYRN